MRKFLSLVLALVMALSLCAPAWAAEGADVSTFEQLKTAITDGATEINLTGSITVNEDYTLTGVTITVAESVTSAGNDAIIVSNNATLTLGAGTTITGYSALLLAYGGNIKIGAGATVEATGATSNGKIFPAVLAYTGTVTVNGGTITSSDNALVATTSQGKAVIEAGSTVTGGAGKVAAYSYGGGSITMNGGTVNGSLTAASSGNTVVNDGKVNGNVAAYGDASASVEIEGGEVTGTVYANDGATLSITGGTFAVDPTPYVAEGYKAFEIVEADGGGYFVAVPYDVTFDANGGNGVLTQAPVPAGQFTLPTEHPFTREGYTFVGWATDKDATEVLGATYDVTGAVTFYAIWEEVPAEDDKPVVVPPVADETVDAEVKVEDVKSSETAITLNEGFTQADIDTAADAEINTEFAITVASPTDIPADVQNELSDADDVIYLDIDLHLYVGEDHVGNITELPRAVEVRIPASVLESFAPVANGYTRTYYVVRFHDGQTDVLRAKLDGEELVFRSDCFSPYYVAYEDVYTGGWGGYYPVVGGTTTPDADETVTSPKTFDAGVALYVGMSVAAAVGTVTLSKKRED